MAGIDTVTIAAMRFCILLVTLQFFSVMVRGQSTNLPNILWISCEDLSPHFSFYGDRTIATPNIDRLAREGITYDNVFATAGVCAPSRCAIIMGMNQVSTGGHNMRTLTNTFPEQTGLPKSYSIVPPTEVKAFPEFLRARGYYCTNNVKTDYQFEEPPTVWDENSATAHWRNRKAGRPFFSVFNYVITHESQVWMRKDKPLHVDPSKITVPPYYPDTRTVRQDMARFFSNVVDLDSLVGSLLQQLETDGLLENTIIFFWSDHGDGLPFSKRELYDRGIKVPLVIRFPGKIKAGTREDQLISLIDLAPTVLSLAGIPTPGYMQGRAFLGPYKSKTSHQYVYAARDRMDSEYDRVRAVRDKKYKYIRNFHPELSGYQQIEFRLQQDMMKEILELKEKQQLDSIQMIWFRSPRPTEEFYDLQNDPYELNNLAKDPAWQSRVLQFRKEMDSWIVKWNDLGAISEKELIKKMWNGNDTAPETNPVTISFQDNKVILFCATPGASIGYKIIEKEKPEAQSWQVYTKPVAILKGMTIKTIAQRIGFKKSKEALREF